ASGRAVHLLLLRPDRAPRPAHAHRARRRRGDDGPDLARALLAPLLDAGRSGGGVLALPRPLVGVSFFLPLFCSPSPCASHALSLRAYVGVFAVLLGLTALTTGVAYVDLGVFNAVVALLIAAAKALLVALFFMHLVHMKHRTQLVAGAGILWLTILIALT